MADDPRIREAHGIAMADLVDQLQITGLVRAGVELVGPCPGCGGNDRFGINTKKNVFQCRKCDAKGDQIALVQLALGMDFRAALEWLAGPKQDLTPAQLAEMDRKAEANRKARQAEADRHRADAIRMGQRIWASGRHANDTVIDGYLARRGLPRRAGVRLPDCLRFEPDARLVVPIPGRSNQFQTVHEGPAMLAAIQGPDGSVIGVHRTWIDLTRRKGRPVIPHPFKAGEFVSTKKVYGSKKGGAIRLYTPRDANWLIMGEGIETTLTALRGHDDAGSAAAGCTGAAYWAGVDLGNMAGRRLLGRGLKYAGKPDLTDSDAFVPPEWVRHLVFVEDGDSDPKLTRAMLLAGLRRAAAKRPGMTGQIIHPGEGVDLNDLLMGDADDEDG